MRTITLQEYWGWIPTEEKSPALLFDIETDGLLDECTRIHSLCILDTATGDLISCANQPGYISIREGLELLAKAPVIVGHNIINFDVPAIHKVYPDWQGNTSTFDTLNATRLIWTDLKDRDFGFARKHQWFPGKLIGSHSLKAWGLRLGEHKDSFGETTDWKCWSKEMQEYCEQDVRTTLRLYRHILAQNYSTEALALEMFFGQLMAKQEMHGFRFDVSAAQTLYAKLSGRRAELEIELQDAFPPKVEEEEFIPKVNNKTRGYVKGVPFIKRKTVAFNPGSRQQIADRLMEKGWKPTEFSETGEPSITDEVLDAMDYPEAKVLGEYLLVCKRIGQLAEGKNAWLKLVKNGRIHGRVNTNGAVTGRCTHSTPNVAQTPTVDVPYGRECRALFCADTGHVLVGGDASGLELRNLAHYMAAWDDGAYAKVILEGDIHWVNALALELVAAGTTYDKHNDTHLWARNKVAKRFIYAFLYGAGDEKLGSILEPGADAETQKKIGAKLRKAFLKAIPAMRHLITRVQEKAGKQKYILGPDKRRLMIRSTHAALNTLLQGAGAILMKLAAVITWWKIEDAGLVWGPDYAFVANIHDELQITCKPEHADTIGRWVCEAIQEAGEHFKFNIPMAGEYKAGANWAETH